VASSRTSKTMQKRNRHKWIWYPTLKIKACDKCGQEKRRRNDECVIR